MAVEEKITFLYTASGVAMSAEQNLRYYKEFQNIGDDLARFNLNRGGKNAFGFEFEQMHAASKNLQNMRMGKGEIIQVLDDNSKKDFMTTTANGGKSFQQAKAGYNGSNKYKTTQEKYKRQTIVVNKDNKEVIEHLIKKGKRYEESAISKESVQTFNSIMQTEGKIRGTLGLDDNTAPITAKLFEAGNQLAAASQVGAKAGQAAAALTAGMSFGKNMYAYIEGNKDLKEVLYDTAADTVKAWIGGFVGGSSSYLAMGMISQTAAGEIVKKAAKVVVETTVGSVLVSVGEITAVLSAAAGPAFLIGMSLGAGYAMCKSIRMRDKAYRNKMISANKALSQALHSMERAYNSLDQEVRAFCDLWDRSINDGFEKMLKSVSDNDFEGFSEGLDNILQLFDSHVLFKTEQEFDEFFFDDSAVLNL